MIYTIKDIPPSNNKFIGKANQWEYQNQKKAWAEMIFYCCNPKPRKPIQRAIVSITYYFKDHRRRDPDNYSGKMILDGLVKAGIIEDDSFRNIRLVLDARFGWHEKKTVIEIVEVYE